MGNKDKKYCLDTSGISNPLESMPEDIHAVLWSKISKVISAGKIAVNTEIFDELSHINGLIGDCIKANCHNLLIEIGNVDWDWASYLKNVERMTITHKNIISEYNGNRKGTVGLNDVSIVAMAKTLDLPLISMEAKNFQSNEKRMRIPGLCLLEGVKHLARRCFMWVGLQP